MKRQNKIYMASTFTGLAAFATLICLFAMDGISLQTAVAVLAAIIAAVSTVAGYGKAEENDET